MNKFKILYQSGLLILLITIGGLTFFIVSLTSTIDFGNLSFQPTEDKIESDTNFKKVKPKVLKEIIKKDTIYIEKTVQVPCTSNHCEIHAVNDSIVP